MAGVADEELLRERLDEEIVGTTVKHHVTREELRRRRNSLEMSTNANQETEVMTDGGLLPR